MNNALCYQLLNVLRRHYHRITSGNEAARNAYIRFGYYQLVRSRNNNREKPVLALYWIWDFTEIWLLRYRGYHV
jgi:hypothetical protein